MKLILECLVVPPFESNCWILGCSETEEAVVIDPGDAAGILQTLKTHQFTVKYLIHTHGHIDHVSATAAIQRQTGAPVLLHEADQILLDNLTLQGTMFGLTAPPAPTVDRHICEGDRIDWGRYTLSVTETPGHSPGGVCLNLEGEKVLFAGDTLFQDSIGRTDLWGGDYEQLLDSIREKLWQLDDDTIVCPGHGPRTTIGREKRENPFLQGL
jgi:glyoxylase-like metal-dependent hydrolase (beta-lactamase superfamily II)